MLSSFAPFLISHTRQILASHRHLRHASSTRRRQVWYSLKESSLASSLSLSHTPSLSIHPIRTPTHPPTHPPRCRASQLVALFIVTANAHSLSLASLHLPRRSAQVTHRPAHRPTHGCARSILRARHRASEACASRCEVVRSAGGARPVSRLEVVARSSASASVAAAAEPSSVSSGRLVVVKSASTATSSKVFVSTLRVSPSSVPASDGVFRTLRLDHAASEALSSAREVVRSACAAVPVPRSHGRSSVHAVLPSAPLPSPERLVAKPSVSSVVPSADAWPVPSASLAVGSSREVEVSAPWAVPVAGFHFRRTRRHSHTRLCESALLSIEVLGLHLSRLRRVHLSRHRP